jgi:hypothetical protein
LAKAESRGIGRPGRATRRQVDRELVADGSVNAADQCWLLNRVVGNID